MLSPDYLARAPDALVKLWQRVEDDILIDVARRLGGMSELTETAEYQLWRLQQLRFVRSDVVSRLAKASSKTDAEIRRLFRDAGVKALTDDDRIYRAAGLSPSDIYTSPALSNLLNAGYRQTTGLWTNLTATTANTVTKQFEGALSHAWLQVSSGAFDYKTAISNAIKGLSASMAYITYPTGHVDTLEVAVRRAVLTGVNQTATKLQLARAEEMDCDLVETSAHQSARPSHAVWQGRVFSRSGKHPKYPDFVASTGYGTGAGLAGWNCRHSFYPFFEGLSETAYSRKELSDYEHATVTYGGKEMSVYDATQRQRALERQVRGQKREYSALKAAGQDASGAAVKLKQARNRLSDFCRQTGLREDGFRSAVNGFGRSAASSASWAARHVFTTDKAQDIIKSTSSFSMGGNAVHFIGRLDKAIYRCVAPDISTDEVIITTKQLAHISERHPEVFENKGKSLWDIISDPDYIIEANKPNTAVILKSLFKEDKRFQVVLRIKASTDPDNFKNSIITMLEINEKTWNKYLRNKGILYSKE